MSEQSEQVQEKKTRKPRTPRPPLDISAMTAAIIAPDAVAKRQRTVKRDGGARKPAQLEIDKLVTAVHAAWVKAGKPEKWSLRPGTQIKVPAAQAETLYSAMYSAGSFLNLRVRRGDVREYEDNGNAMVDVVFTVTDMPPAKPATEPAADAGPVPSPADVAAKTGKASK
jgi:hypothetical protein